MKHKTLILLAGAALMCACQPSQRQTVISGTLEGVESDTLIVRHFAIGDLMRADMQTDTVVLQNGRFSLTIANDSTPTEAYFYAKPRGKANLAGLTRSVAVVAYPGETTEVSGSMEDYRTAGNTFQQALQAVNDLCKPYRQQMDSISALMVSKQQAGAPMDTIRTIYEQAYSPLRDKMEQVQADYARQHPDEDIAVYLTAQLGREQGEALLPLLGDNAKQGAMSSLYQALIEAVNKQKAREEAQKSVVEGSQAPDFTLKDLKGNDLALSSLRGKYVVLDFWGSWCGWCIKGIPDMKKYYDKYKDRMEILGIDCRDTEQKWRDAVEKHQLPWLHVRNAGEPDVSVMYGIQGYPTKIVVDPEGKITKIVIGEDPAFYEYLDGLFAKK